MHYLYRYVCILNVFFICVYGQLSAIKNLLLLLLLRQMSLKYASIHQITPFFEMFTGNMNPNPMAGVCVAMCTINSITFGIKIYMF